MRTYTRTLFAALLCAALLCLPALAAEDADAPGAGAYEPNPQYTVIWGTVTRQENGSLLVQKSGASAPTDGYVLWTEHAAILDAVTGAPADAASIQNGSTVYAWGRAQSPMTMSLPPQTAPELLLVNVPADFHVPQYDIIVRSDGLTSLGIPERSGMAITLSDGSTLQVWEEAQIAPYLTRNRVTCQDLTPGTRVLVWTDAQGEVCKVLVFPSQYKGSVSLDSYGRLYINSAVTLSPSALRRPYRDERLYAPIRAVAEAAGYTVSWDNALGAVVKDGGETVFSILPDSKALRGSAVPDVDGFHLSGPCLIADGVTYLEIGDLARLLDLFYGG